MTPAIIVGLIIGFQFNHWIGMAAFFFTLNCHVPQKDHLEEREAEQRLRRIITKAIEDAKDEEKP